MATLPEVCYPDGSKSWVSKNENGNVYMNVFSGDVKDENEHSYEGYEISGDLKEEPAYKGGHDKRSEDKDSEKR